MSNNLTFDAFASFHVPDRLVAASTAEKYRGFMQAACQSIGHVKIDAITSQHIQSCLADYADTKAPSSVAGFHSFIRSVLRQAGSSAADGIKGRVRQPNTRVLDTDEAGRLRTHLDGVVDFAVANALLVLLGTGIRRGELLNLTVDDWREGARQLHISRSKNGRVRAVDVPDWVVPVLDRQAAGRGLDCVLFDVSKDAMRRGLNAACSALGLPAVRLHDLRHTRITHLLLQGAPSLYVSQQAGHSSPAFTLTRYGHLIAASAAQRRTWCNV